MFSTISYSRVYPANLLFCADIGTFQSSRKKTFILCWHRKRGPSLILNILQTGIECVVFVIHDVNVWIIETVLPRKTTRSVTYVQVTAPSSNDSKYDGSKFRWCIYFSTVICNGFGQHNQNILPWKRNCPNCLMSDFNPTSRSGPLTHLWPSSIPWWTSLFKHHLRWWRNQWWEKKPVCSFVKVPQCCWVVRWWLRWRLWRSMALVGYRCFPHSRLCTPWQKDTH